MWIQLLVVLVQVSKQAICASAEMELPVSCASSCWGKNPERGQFSPAGRNCPGHGRKAPFGIPASKRRGIAKLGCAGVAGDLRGAPCRQAYSPGSRCPENSHRAVDRPALLRFSQRIHFSAHCRAPAVRDPCSIGRQPESTSSASAAGAVRLRRRHLRIACDFRQRARTLYSRLGW